MVSPKKPSLKPTVLWMVMLSNGRVMGPYSTEAVLKLISEGALTGDERIKKSQGGTWIPISKESDFYDRLLEALHEDSKPNSQLSETMSQETVIVSLPPDALIPFADLNQKSPPEKSGHVEETAIFTEAKSPAVQLHPLANKTASVTINPGLGSGSQSTPSIVDLQNLGVASRTGQFSRIKVPLMLGLISVSLLTAALFWQQEATDENIHLIVPRYSGSSTLTGLELKKAVTGSLQYFQNDTLESYLEAQNKFVSILESGPHSLEARGFLCLTYRELWPFAKQDSSDIEAVNALVKSTKAMDPVGASGAYCEISKLLMFGKTTDARGILDYLLNQQQFSTDPVLISLKAEVLASEQDPKSAALFIETVKQLWPNWVKASTLQAEFLMQSGQTQASAAAYEKVIKQSPKHKAAQIQYAILSYRYFKQTDLALNFLTAALNSKSRVLRQLEAKANFTLAQILSEKKQKQKAKAYAQRAFDLNPGDAQYKDLLLKLGGTTELSRKTHRHNELVFLGDQYFRAGDCLSAQAEYKAAFEIDPTNALAATKAGKCLWQLNQSMEAINWLNKAIKADARLTEPYVMQADYYSQRYNYVSALQILTKASVLFPNNNEILRGYGLLEFRRNNIKDAIGYLQRSLKLYENDIETLLLLAKAHGNAGEFQLAQNYAIRAMELDSTNNEAIVVYAKNLVQFRGLEAGLFFIRDQISKFSYTIEFRVALGEIYKDVERYRDAQNVFEQVTDQDPRNKKAFLGLGESLQNQGQFDKALRAYLNAAVLDPSDAEPLFRAGLLYVDMNRFVEAMKQFQRALKVNPLYPRGHYYFGKAAFLNGDYQTALQACQEERKVNPNLADSYILAADIYATVKDFGKCAAEYQTAVKLRPQGAEIYVKMARCYRQFGNPDISESMLNIAATIESGLPDIYREQGAVYEAKGDIRSAVAAYNKYLALSPNAPDRVEIEKKIETLGQ